MEPIFIGITRSFWFTTAGMAILFGAGDEILISVASLLDPLPFVNGPVLGDYLVSSSPAVLWLLAMNERKGAARPYTINPRALT